MHKHNERRQTDRAQNWNFSLFVLFYFSERTNVMLSNRRTHLNCCANFSGSRMKIRFFSSIFISFVVFCFFFFRFWCVIWSALFIRIEYATDDVQIVCVVLCSIFSEMNFYNRFGFRQTLFLNYENTESPPRMESTKTRALRAQSHSTCSTLTLNLNFIASEMVRLARCVYHFFLSFLSSLRFFLLSFRFVSLLLPLPLLLHAQRAYTDTVAHTLTHTHTANCNWKSTL